MLLTDYIKLIFLSCLGIYEKQQNTENNSIKMKTFHNYNNSLSTIFEE